MPTPTTDFSIFDWQELVRYEPVIGDAADNVPALRRPLTQSGMRNVERYVELLPTDVVFHVDSTNLVSASVMAGDIITDAGGRTYRAMFCERQTLNNTIDGVFRLFE